MAVEHGAWPLNEQKDTLKISRGLQSAPDVRRQIGTLLRRDEVVYGERIQISGVKLVQARHSTQLHCRFQLVSQDFVRSANVAAARLHK